MKTLLLAGALLLLAGGRPACRAADSAGAPVPPRTLTTRFTYKATVPQASANAKALDLWLPLPSDGEFQTVTGLKVDSPLPHQIHREPEFGNRMIHVRSGKPSDSLTVTVSFVVRRKLVQILSGAPDPARAGDDSARELRRLTRPDKKVPIGGRYGRIAKDVSTGQESPREKARAFFEHVVETMQYDYQKKSPKLGEGDVAFARLSILRA